MATLRAPDGCPWDREQTIDSLKPYVLEETYEVLEAIDRARPRRAPRGTRAISCSRPSFVAQLEAGGGTFHRRRRADRASPTSWCGGTRTCSRASEGDAPLGSRPRCVTRWEQIKAAGARQRRRSRRRCSAASRRPCPPCSGPTRSACAPRSVGFDWSRPPTSWTRSRRRSTSCGSGRRRRADGPRARRGGDGRPALLHREPVAAARDRARRPRCARRTTSSRSASRRWNTSVAQAGPDHEEP